MNTEYDSPDWLVSGAPDGVLAHIIHVLWDCSTAYMVEHGLPTNEQVAIWVTILNSRPDADDSRVQQAVDSCREYMKPYVPPVRSSSGYRSVPIGTVIKVKKISSKEM